MNDLGLLLTLFVSGLATFLIRLSFIAGERWLPRGDALHTVLGYVPAAVLAALIAPELLVRNGTLALTTDNARLLAGLVAIAAALTSRSVMATILAGMSALWLLAWLGG